MALEQGGLQKEITVTADHMVEGSSMYLKVGETVTVRAYAAAGGIAEPLYSVEVAEALVEVVTE